MVEKTKRALSILQTRDRGTATESDMKRAANEIIRITEDRITEIKRRAGMGKKNLISSGTPQSRKDFSSFNSFNLFRRGRKRSKEASNGGTGESRNKKQ